MDKFDNYETIVHSLVVLKMVVQLLSGENLFILKTITLNL